ncbi:hypothetical protein BJ508DRAFT_327014 [Ascobolus immersus RN42]|uniref:Cora-domain-containing protein n=1 Tax=Ascobolus immersus RN42 TaxID=1160509 RepID=A0A3N4I482_ASCIM|nr:hypothetical protein BJ508DRAFT_327014 [Ascobolus immersus RN42]
MPRPVERPKQSAHDWRDRCTIWEASEDSAYTFPLLPVGSRGDLEPTVRLDLSLGGTTGCEEAKKVHATIFESTRQTLKRWTKEYYSDTSASPHSQDSGSEGDTIVLFLLKIVLRDCSHVLSAISEELLELQEAMQTEHSSVVIRSLPAWQALLLTHRKELRKMAEAAEMALYTLHMVSTIPTPRERSFPNIVNGCAHGLAIGQIPETAPPELKGCFLDYLRFQRLIEIEEGRVREVSGMLMSTLSIIESQKAIDEAESVTKLTEMAFFFLPLGFSASIFGMQVKEFENSVSIYIWLLTAFALVAGSYITRLMVRSRFVRSKKQQILAEARVRNGLEDSEEIPFASFLKHLPMMLAIQIRLLRPAARSALNRLKDLILKKIKQYAVDLGDPEDETFYSIVKLIVKLMFRKIRRIGGPKRRDREAELARRQGLSPGTGPAELESSYSRRRPRV